jgi:predicted unusual protein kinase regulating ubiquinone biosynthesis (AarF/ABC1/UbiB family)
VFLDLVKVALLDYGQVKELSEDLRLGFARLVVALASNNVSEIVSCFKYALLSPLDDELLNSF